MARPFDSATLSIARRSALVTPVRIVAVHPAGRNGNTSGLTIRWIDSVSYRRKHPPTPYGQEIESRWLNRTNSLDSPQSEQSCLNPKATRSRVCARSSIKLIRLCTRYQRNTNQPLLFIPEALRSSAKALGSPIRRLRGGPHKMNDSTLTLGGLHKRTAS